MAWPYLLIVLAGFHLDKVSCNLTHWCHKPHCIACPQHIFMGITHSHCVLALHTLSYKMHSLELNLLTQMVYTVWIGFVKCIPKFRTILGPNGNLSSPDTHFPKTFAKIFLLIVVNKKNSSNKRPLYDPIFFIPAKKTIHAPV